MYSRNMVTSLATLSVFLVTVLYQVPDSTAAAVVKLDMFTRYDPCRPMGDSQSIPNEYDLMTNGTLPFRVRVFPSQDNINQRVQIVGKLFTKVFAQARAKSNSWAPLVGTWSNHDIPKGHKVLKCESRPESTVTSDTDNSYKAHVTYTWKGTCTSDVVFFIYISFDGRDWQNVRVPCEIFRPEEQKDAATVGVQDWFTAWSKYGRCTKTCGNSTQSRFRKCLHEESCEGETRQTRSCVLPPCDTQACKDKNIRCSAWKRSEYCTGPFAVWIRNVCPKACGVCVQNSRTRTTCRDSSKYTWSCHEWAMKNRCNQSGFWLSFVRKSCRASCGLC